MEMVLSKLREIMKDREAWRAAVHEVAKSWIRLCDCTIHALVLITMLFLVSSWEKNIITSKNYQTAIIVQHRTVST